MRLKALVILVLGTAAIPALAQPDLDGGRRSYEVCAGCHGFLGEGNRLVNAPRLAGIEPWYLERQVQNFRAGRRGQVDGDANGQRMALIAQAVDNERELADLMAWIGSLPIPQLAAETAAGAVSATASEPAAAGQSLFSQCSACHGRAAEGNANLNAPALVALDDWYLREQLRLFAEGLRGTHPADTYGIQMRALASSFDNETKRQALASYIATLRP